MRTSLRDVAAIAGVSLTTVSYVLNDQGAISEETRQRVKAAIRETGYQRQRRAMGSLALVETHVSFLTPYLHQAVAEYGYALHSAVWPETLQSPPGFTVRPPVVGVLLFGGTWPGSLIDQLVSKHPTVLLGSSLPMAQTDTVWVDSSAGIYAATMHLLAQGHVRIALINGPRGSATSAEKRMGFERALQTRGLDDSGIVVEAADFTVQAGTEAARRLLDAEYRPTAVIAGESVLGNTLVQVGEALGLKIPQDLSVIVFRDNVDCEKHTPPLTAIRLPAIEIAREAVARLMRRIQDPTGIGQRVLLQPQLIVRQSVAPLCMKK